MQTRLLYLASERFQQVYDIKYRVKVFHPRFRVRGGPRATQRWLIHSANARRLSISDKVDNREVSPANVDAGVFGRAGVGRSSEARRSSSLRD